MRQLADSLDDMTRWMAEVREEGGEGRERERSGRG